MNARETSKAISPRSLTGMLAVCLFGSFIAYAQKPAPSKPAAAAPHPAAAAPKAAAPAASHAPASGAAAHSPTTSTAGHTTTSTAGKGPSTSTAGHTTTSTAGKSTTTAGAGHTTATAGHAPAAAASHAPAAGGHATPAASHSPAGGGRTASGHMAPAGHTTAHNEHGAVTRGRDGKVRDVHNERRGMDVHHGLSGGRSVRVEGRDGHRVYAERGGRGYVQGRYSYHGREYGHRTYYEHGRAYDRFYRGYPYHGVYVEMYAPAFYYRPAFYGWAYNPWVTPVPYAWGFAVNPWYGYYGGYFTPYPVYASASLWLTDYMISQTLAAAYQARVDAAAAAQAQAAANVAPLTPDVKNLIAAEVQRQIALANAESQTVAANKEIDPASSGIQRMLSDNIQHVFIAGKDLDVVDAQGTECAITEGDALQLSGPPAAAATAASLVVLSSKGGVECRKGVTVTVEVADLQDMQNHMRETIDAGMGELQTKQGKGGLPALPPSANAPPTKTAFAAEAPPPDPTAATQISQQMQEADKAEQEVVAASGPSDQGGTTVAAATPPAPPKQLGLGMSVDEVIAINGQPKNVLDLGNKKLSVYKDMKITFTAGKVTDMQ
jgi:hypothetical protein